MTLPSKFWPPLLLVTLFTSTRAAWPCSLAPRADDAKLSGVVGPNPLLFSLNQNATLSDPLGQSVPLRSINPPRELGVIRGAHGTPLFFFRPAAPLPAGEYLLDGTQFTVSSTAADVPPELGARGNLELHLAEEGSGGMCGDISMLLIDLLEKPATDEEHAVFLLQFERSGGPGFSRLVSVPDRFESTIRFRFYHSFHETGHLRSEKLCVKIAGLSQTGTVGPSLDLGCVDPLDETDPRVFHSEGSGCSTIGAGAGLSGLWILLGAGLIVRIRRRAR